MAETVTLFSPDKASVNNCKGCGTEETASNVVNS